MSYPALASQIMTSAKDAWFYVADHMPASKNYYDFWNSDKYGITVSIDCGTWDTLMYQYGHKVLLYLIEYYKDKEDYERCQSIVDAIIKHNEFCNDELPTSL